MGVSTREARVPLRPCLDDNGFTGNLPRDIRAVNLILLNLSGNQLTGEIPQGFGNLKNLKRLFLQNNRFTGC
jgi:Leucine-rich repeat (LRR) protein